MKAWQARLISEAIELNTKLINLKAFINEGQVFGTLGGKEQTLLLWQLHAMKSYYATLEQRIAMFKESFNR